MPCTSSTVHVYPRQTTVILRLPPAQAEVLYWELLALHRSYSSNRASDYSAADETAMLAALRQLELELARAEATGQAALQQLRCAIPSRPAPEDR